MSFYWVRFRRHNRDDLGGDRAQEPACPPLILGMASWADIFRDLRRQVRELKQEEVVSCPRGAISGFVFRQQDVGRLREPRLLLPLWNSETGPQQLHLARAPECCAGGERQRKGLASGSQAPLATSFPSCVQPLLSLGVLYLVCKVGILYFSRISDYKSTVRW